MPSHNMPVQTLKVAILPLDLPCSGLVTHSGNISITGKSHKTKPDGSLKDDTEMKKNEFGKCVIWGTHLSIIFTAKWSFSSLLKKFRNFSVCFSYKIITSLAGIFCSFSHFQTNVITMYYQRNPGPSSLTQCSNISHHIRDPSSVTTLGSIFFTT